MARKEINARQYEEKQNLLQQQNRSHLENVAAQAQQLINQQRWLEAERLIKQTQSNAVVQHNFDTLLATLTQQQDAQLTSSTLSSDMAKMVWLKAEQKRLQQIQHSTYKNLFSQLQNFRTQRELRSINRKLLHCAKSNFESNRIKQAKTCFNYIDAAHLPAGASTDFQILSHYFHKNTLNKVVRKNEPKKAVKTTVTRKQDLHKSLSLHLENANLSGIKSTLEKIEKSPTFNKEQDKKYIEAKQFLSSQIEKLDQRADQLYSNERISQASSIWEYLLPLAEDGSAIQQKYQRSQRVLEKMQTLRENNKPKADLATTEQNKL